MSAPTVNNLTNLAVVDGANGYVGSNLIRSLLDDGRRVIALARGEGARTRAAVAGAVIRGSDDPDHALIDDALQCFDYSLSAPDLGLPAEALAALSAEPCDYWHLAANINFRPGNQEEVMAINVGGTRNAVAAFLRHAAPGSRYFLVSTAYCCGSDTIQPREAWYESAPPQHFRNTYERSKREGELVVREAMEQRELSGTVLRLGQIVGDSQSGRSSTDYGMYNLIRAVWAVARRKPGEHVRIEGHHDANMHLVPIDACVRWMRAVGDNSLSAPSPPIVHVVDQVPIPARDVVATIARHVPLELSIATTAELRDRPTTLLERVVAARMAYTGSYLSQPFQFGRANLDDLLGVEAVAVDEEVLDRVIGSFMRTLAIEFPAL